MLVHVVLIVVVPGDDVLHRFGNYLTEVRLLLTHNHDIVVLEISFLVHDALVLVSLCIFCLRIDLRVVDSGSASGHGHDLEAHVAHRTDKVINFII